MLEIKLVDRDSIKKGDFLAYQNGRAAYFVMSVERGTIELKNKHGIVYFDQKTPKFKKINANSFDEIPDDPEILGKVLFANDYIRIPTFVGELWKEIPGNPNLFISNFGRTKSTRDVMLEKFIDIFPGKSGQLYMNLNVNEFFPGNISYLPVAYLVLKCFVDNPNNYSNFKHKNGNLFHNHYANLEWVNDSAELDINKIYEDFFNTDSYYDTAPSSKNNFDFLQGYKLPYELSSKVSKEVDVECKNNLDSPKISYIQYNDQKWMLRNLDVGKFRNGDEIQEICSDEEWEEAGYKGIPAWCYYNNDRENGNIYGRLYNWHAVNDPRGLAPKGWHIPDKTEWRTLEYYLISKGYGSWPLGTSIGKSLASCSGWSGSWSMSRSYDPNIYIINDQLNRSGFCALPGGSRAYGRFQGLTTKCRWWTSGVYGFKYANYIELNSNFTDLSMASIYKECGHYVRCVKDD